MDNLQINFVGPIAPILGAIVGGLITLVVTYALVIKRKSLGFWVSKAEDLTSSLRRHHNQIVVSVGGQSFLNLNRAMVEVENRGNVALENFKFEIEVAGEHKGYLADVIADEEDLRKGITITKNDTGPVEHPRFQVNVAGFLNPKEQFRVAVFFDGEVSDCVVRCRIPDVKAKVRRAEDRVPLSTLLRIWTGWFVAAIVVAMTTWFLKLLSSGWGGVW
jgi:hypothetical protein